MVNQLLSATMMCGVLLLLAAMPAHHSPRTTHHSLELAMMQESAPPDSGKPKRGIEKLDNKSRAKALAALAGLVILGLAMIALTWLGARVTMRYMNPTPFDHERIKSSQPPADDWASKPLVDNSEFTGKPAQSPNE